MAPGKTTKRWLIVSAALAGILVGCGRQEGADLVQAGKAVRPVPEAIPQVPLGPGTVRPKEIADFGAINDLRARKDWAGAIRRIDRELERHPDHGDLHYLRGDCHRMAGNTDQAIADFRRSLSVKEGAVLVFHPTEVRKKGLAAALHRRGAEAGNRRDFDGAIRDLGEALRLDPGLAEARTALAAVYHNRGSAHARKVEVAQAIADYTEAIRLNPASVGSYVQRGYEYAGQNRHDRAIADFTAALRSDPRNFLALYSRGVSHERTGNQEGAIADFTAALRVKPNDASAHHARGVLFARKRLYGQAVADFTRAIELDPSNPAVYGDRHDAYRALGNNAAADADLAHFRRLQKSR